MSGAPRARRQLAQWRFAISFGSPLARQPTAPQRQRPVVFGLGHVRVPAWDCRPAAASYGRPSRTDQLPPRSLKAVGADRLERDRKPPLGPEHDPEEQAGAEQGNRQPGDRRRPLPSPIPGRTSRAQTDRRHRAAPIYRNPIKIARRASFGKPALPQALEEQSIVASLGRKRLPCPIGVDAVFSQTLRRGRTPECAPTLIHGGRLQRPDQAARSGGVPLAFPVGLVALLRLSGGPEHAQQPLGNLLIEHLIAKLAQSLIELRVAVGCRPLVVL
jgi:hypothetical protein